MIQTLISGGHRWSEILEYTLGQVLLFHSCVIKEELRRRAGMVVDMAVAQHAKQKDRKAYVDALLKPRL